MAMITRNGSAAALIDLRSFEVLADLTLPRPNAALTHAAFDPSGGTLVMTTDTGYTFVWDLAAMRRHLGQLGWTGRAREARCERRRGMPHSAEQFRADPSRCSGEAEGCGEAGCVPRRTARGRDTRRSADDGARVLQPFGGPSP
jgi:hypothetical protein